MNVWGTAMLFLIFLEEEEMKKILSLLVIILVLGLASCDRRVIEEPDDPIIIDDNDNNKDPFETIKLSEIYQDLSLYDARLQSLTSMEGEVSSYQPNLLKLMEVSHTKLTKEELQARYYDSSVDFVYDNYLEWLLTASHFVTAIKEKIADDLDKEVGETFYPDESDDSLEYTFLLSEEGYIVIAVKYGFHQHIIKIGMSEDKLEYKELHYSYVNDFDPLEDEILVYNYSSFEEGKEAVYINSLENSFDLGYTSIETNRNFTISRGENRVEAEGYQDELGYTLNQFDPVNNVSLFIDVVDNQIVSETYDVFSDYGQLYRYQDFTLQDDEVQLMLNIIEAEGWDYILYSDNTLGDLEGVYSNDDTPIYQGNLRVTYTPTHAWVAVDKTVSKEELFGGEDQIFNLDYLGLTIANTKMTRTFFESIQLESFDEIKETFLINNLNFFVEDIREELYQYIDQDILNALEGNGLPEDPIDPDDTDKELFLSMMGEYISNVIGTGTFSMFENGVMTTTYPGYEEVDTREFHIQEMMNLDALYYKTYHYGLGKNGAFEILNVQDYLYGITLNNMMIEYENLSSASTEDFFDVLSLYSTIIDADNGLTSVTQISDYVFEAELSYEALGIGTRLLLSQNEISGLQNANITAEYTFAEDGTWYVMEIEVNGLGGYTMNRYGEKVYTSTKTYGLEELTMTSLLDYSNAYFYLPQKKEDNLFLYEIDYSDRFYVREGDNYLLYYLEEDTYRFSHNTDHCDVEIMVTDLEGNQIGGKDFEVTTPSYYFINIQSDCDQGVQGGVIQHTPIVIQENELEPVGGIFNETLDELGYMEITIPLFSSPKLLMIEFDSNSTSFSTDGVLMINADNPLMFSNHECHIEPGGIDNYKCYFNILQNSEEKLYIDSAGFDSIAFTYQFIDMRVEMEELVELQIDNIDQGIEVLVNQYQPLTRIFFTITNEITYEILLDSYIFGSTTHTINLYHEDGTLIDEYIDLFTYTYQPGVYYIEIVGPENPVLFFIDFVIVT
jgi:hypothetical protein